jgi:hypothetical protein
MESTIKLGEVEMTMTSGVTTAEELKVLLRWGWGAETTGKLAFNPSAELKVGDGIRVLVEKVITVPDPVEEKVEEAPEAAAANPETCAEKCEAVAEAAAANLETCAEKCEAVADASAESVADSKSE